MRPTHGQNVMCCPCMSLALVRLNRRQKQVRFLRHCSDVLLVPNHAKSTTVVGAVRICCAELLVDDKSRFQPVRLFLQRCRR